MCFSKSCLLSFTFSFAQNSFEANLRARCGQQSSSVMRGHTRKYASAMNVERSSPPHATSSGSAAPKSVVGMSRSVSKKATYASRHSVRQNM